MNKHETVECWIGKSSTLPNLLRQELPGLGSPDVCPDVASLSKAFQHSTIRKLLISQRLFPTPLGAEDTRSLVCSGVWINDSLLSQMSPFEGNISLLSSLSHSAHVVLSCSWAILTTFLFPQFLCVLGVLLVWVCLRGGCFGGFWVVSLYQFWFSSNILPDLRPSCSRNQLPEFSTHFAEKPFSSHNFKI